MSDFDAPLVEADIASIADEKAEADLSADPIADIVADDSARCGSGNDFDDIEAAGLACINCRSIQIASPGRGKPMLSKQTTRRPQTSHIS